jgi:phosphoribosylanthranilate isomerase
MSRVKVKICGVTRVEDARLAAELGADYLGLNFFAASPRLVEPEQAAEIARAVRGRLAIVGVFVNESRERVEELAEKVPLDLVQLHGDAGSGLRLPDGGGVALRLWPSVALWRHRSGLAL